MKRGIMYNTCRREGYNVLVLGQHLDDLAESFIMSIFHNGLLRTQKANYMNDEGDVRIIRPMIYVRERACKKVAWDNRLPVIDENCPACFEMPKSRQRVKTLLASQENLYPDLYSSLIRAMKPLLEKDMAHEGNQKFKKNDENKWTIEKALSGKKEMPKGRSIEDLKKKQKLQEELKKKKEDEDVIKIEEVKIEEKELKTEHAVEQVVGFSMAGYFKQSMVYIGLMTLSFVVGYKMKK